MAVAHAARGVDDLCLRADQKREPLMPGANAEVDVFIVEVVAFVETVKDTLIYSQIDGPNSSLTCDN